MFKFPPVTQRFRSVPSLPGYEAMSFGKQLPAFQTIVFPSSSGSSSHIILRLVTLLYPEEEKIRLLQMSVAIYKYTRYKIPEDVNLYFKYCLQGST